MVSSDGVYYGCALAVLLTKFGTDESMGSLDFMAYGLADIMEQCSPSCEGYISAERT